MSEQLARLRSVSKRFGSLQAVDGLSLDVHAGEVHGLVGGNGAGKTTAMKILGGLLRPDAGEVIVGGSPIAFHSRRDAIRAGVGFIQQEFSLVESMTCADNLLLGHPEHGFVLDRGEAAELIAAVGERFGASLDPGRLVRTLSMGERQQLEILIALSWGGKIVILDEPTSSTGESGMEFLRTAIGLLRESGIGVIYISHKLPEVLELADRITVMRRGRVVWEGPAEGAEPMQLAREMVGDSALLESGRRSRQAPADVLLRIDTADLGWSEEGRSLHDIKLEVHRHEIVGIAGVVGNGQRELAQLAAGLITPNSGSVIRPLTAGYVAEDRGRDSLALDMSPAENAIVHAHRRPVLVRHGFLRQSAVREFTLRLLQRFGVDPTVVDRADAVWQLSGGNQQRLVLGRELDESSDLLVLHNPARGLDVAATSELFRQLDEFCEAGGGALLISPDLDELIRWSDAIQVLYEGRLSERLPAERGSIHELASRMAGVT